MKYRIATHNGHGWKSSGVEYDTEEDARREMARAYPVEVREHRATVLCTRFAITHVNRNGVRTLSHANQGRHHYDTREEAERSIAAMKKNNHRDVIDQVWGAQAFDTFAVREVECYSHGDAIGIYFDN